MKMFRSRDYRMQKYLISVLIVKFQNTETHPCYAYVFVWYNGASKYITQGKVYYVSYRIVK